MGAFIVDDNDDKRADINDVEKQQSEYAKKQIDKFMAVINAAKLNPIHHQGVMISTVGSEPRATVTIPAYLIEKFIKAR